MKSLFLFLALAPAIGFSQTTFQCVTTASGSKHHLKVSLNPVNLIPGKNYARAQVELSNTKETAKSCVVFSIAQQYLRLGYLLTYSGTLPNGVLVNLVERSFTNEGPSSFSFGYLEFQHGKPGAEKVALDCVKE